MLDVFYSPKTVMHRFLERIYEQRLQDYIDEVLDVARKRSLQLYLEKLHSLYKRSKQVCACVYVMCLCVSGEGIIFFHKL